MAQQLTVSNDPEAIRDYWRQIEQTIEDLKTQLKETGLAIDIVSEGWKDGNFQQFQGNFNQDKEMINPLCDALHEYVSLLQQLEKKLRDYGELEMHL